MDREARYRAKVEVRGPDECWPWLASIGTHGYGAFWDGKRVTTAHVYGMSLLGGVIPEGMTLDHACRNRWCQNPAHWRVVSRGTNVLFGDSPSAMNARKTHCIRNHPLSGDNLIITSQGRRCRTCYNAAARRGYHRRKGEMG